MLFVACSGFPVPVSRYFREFPAVEISDTEIAMPGAGTVRRWLREAPAGFAFTVLAPKSIARSGFEKSKDNKEACAAVFELAQTLSAKAVVFVGEDDFKPTKATKASVKSFLSLPPTGGPPVVLDLPAWKTAQVQEVIGKRSAVAAYDPLHDEPSTSRSLAYLRLNGPAGHRSRYDEDALTEVAAHCRELTAELAFCVFRNIDMQTNAATLRAKLE
jgi:uncharacterized protein YecE (DUF72 family)